MFFGKPKGPQPTKRRVEIARIDGAVAQQQGTGTAGLAAIGFIVMILLIVFESSAIRLAAWGTIWTGWNVLCLFGMLRTMRTAHTVYRVEDLPQNPDDRA